MESIPAKPSLPVRRGSVGSAVGTALSTIVVGGTAAAAGIVLARRFGRDAVTDGFLAAYGVYLILSLAAQALRLVVLPEFARSGRRLGGELLGYALTIALVGCAACALVLPFADSVGRALTGGLPESAAVSAASALEWLVPAGFVQLLVALLASALAARNSYLTAAFAYALGSASALLVFVLRSDGHGPLALAWGLAAGSVLTLAILGGALMQRDGVVIARPRPFEPFRRFARLAAGVSLPLALQAFYVIALRVAADKGVGSVTSFAYAYIVAAALVAATASTLALVSSVPLTRRGLDADRAADHVVYSAWLSFAGIAGFAGLFALTGGRIVEAFLGEAFGGESGRALGSLVVHLAPWMAATAVVSTTFPLLFIFGRRWVFLPLAVGGLLVDIALTLALDAAFGLNGIAVALGVTAFVVLALLLAAISQAMLTRTAVGLVRPVLTITAVAIAAFGACSLLLPDIPAAILGLLLYTVVLVALRPAGLRDAWSHIRNLG
jgi:putative peptidoglycan lipid II flippase